MERRKSKEIIPEIPQRGKSRSSNIDEQYRSDTSLENSKLKPIYGCKAVTAGNAPGLNDGATAIIVMTRKKANDLGLKSIGTILAMTSIAIHPNRMPEGPGFAIQKVLKMANLKLDQIDVI
jgi:acetyl-CoA C-acetyltransferase